MLRGEKLGEGTFGIVYLATSPSTRKQYAVKRNLAEEKMSFIGVSREVDMLNRLRLHPHIVRLERVTFGQPFNFHGFSPLRGKERHAQRDDSMHFVFGKADYDLHRFIYGAVTVNFSLIKRYMVQLLLAVEYTHGQGIVHRDIKPTNVLIFGPEVDVQGHGNVAKLCDFGLAKPHTYQGKQTPRTVTSWYRAPEISLGYPHYDYKVDVWSLACTFFEMVAKRAFIKDVSDNDDDIISAILGKLPHEISMRKFRELVRSNKWRIVKLGPAYSPGARLTWKQQLGLQPAGIQQFNREAGSFDAFCELLESMFVFDWNDRPTCTEVLAHPFFADYQDYIAQTRKEFPPKRSEPLPLAVRDCVERKWMAQIVTDIFNNRGDLRWYNDRALFQAMDLFDRYLHVMFEHTAIPKNAVESDLKGFIHDKFGAELRFMSCLYLCVKYFSSIHHPIPFNDVVTEKYRTPKALLEAEQFEGGFIMNCLQYNIYRPTVYEAADQFGDKLGEEEIRDLIVLYSMNTSFSGMTPPAVYKYYKEHLREHVRKHNSLEFLYQPLQQ